CGVCVVRPESLSAIYTLSLHDALPIWLIALFLRLAFSYFGSFHLPCGINSRLFLASGSRLFLDLSPIHTNPLRLAKACVSLINPSILRYLSKNDSRNSSASSTPMPSESDSPYLLAPYIDDSSTTFICFRYSVSEPSGNL